MNVVLVCVCMPIFPFASYFVLSALGVSSMIKVIIPEIFTIAYVILVVAVVIKKVSEDEKKKKFE